MLCFLFMLHVLVFHAYNVKCSAKYRKKSTHQKINRAYQSLRISVWAAHFIFRPHHVLRHLSVLHPKSASTVLWLVPPCAGFDIVLTCSMISNTGTVLSLLYCVATARRS